MEAELKSLSTSEDFLTLKQSGELLSDDHDAPTSKKACESDEGFPHMLTSSPVRPLQRTSLWPFSPVATSHPRQIPRSNKETVNVLDIPSGVQNAKAVDVLIKVKWPLKDAERKFPEDLESLGKMIAPGMYKQIVNAAWQNKSLKKELTELVQKDIEKECSYLCSKKDPSCLRKTSKDDMLSFSMEKLAMEIQERAPLFHSILSADAINRKSKAKNPSPQAEFGAIGMAAAICLHNRSQYMIAVQLLITDFLYHSNWLVSN